MTGKQYYATDRKLFMRIIDLEDKDLSKLIENRKTDSLSVSEEISRIYSTNKAVYSNQPDWVKNLPPNQPRLTNGRIFTDTEAVINTVINNTSKPNVVPNRDGEGPAKVAGYQEKYFLQRYTDLNVKEILRKAVRDLYFSRLMVLKPFWNVKTDDFDVKRIDPRRMRFSPTANNEIESEIAFEEIDSTAVKLISLYPKYKEQILKELGLKDETEAMVVNPKTTYWECWVDKYLVVQFKSLILWKGRNPYWDWDGMLVTKDEHYELLDSEKEPKEILRRLGEAERKDEEGNVLGSEQELRRSEQEAAKEEAKDKEHESEDEDELPYDAYLFNHFDFPRKPYIFASVLKNEDGNIGNTSFIEMATPLAEAADRTKMQISRNMRMVNGITKVNDSSMTKEQAEKLRYDTGGIIWGTDVVTGVTREFGQPLPQFVFQDMEQSLSEIDNIMAATSAFRGERDGQETKAGRIALVEQSFLRLNELVQTVDFASQEIFNWWFQLAKVRYTEAHYVKSMGEDRAMEVIELSREDFEKGTQIRIIPGKTLPEDRQFKFDRAQNDVAKGYISPLQYLKDAGYDNPLEVAQEAFEFKTNPASVLGIAPPTSVGAPVAPSGLVPQGMEDPMAPPAPDMMAPPTA